MPFPEQPHRTSVRQLDPEALEDALWDVAALLIAVDTTDQAVAALANSIARLVPVEGLEILELDRRSGSLVTIHAVGDASSTLGTGHPLAEVARAVAATGEAMWDNEAGAGSGGDGAELAIVAVPLDAGHGPIGTLLVRRQGREVSFDVREFDVLCQFGRLAALVLSKARRTRLLEVAAETDELTKLPNRRSFTSTLSLAMDAARDAKSPLSLLMFDVDDFKSVNDRFGHDVGDQVLRRIAATAREACRGADIACRTGGEEFSIILPEASAAAAHVVGQRLLSLLAALSVDPVGVVTVSAGVAQWDHHSDSRELVQVADRRLYAAKARGKACVVSDEGGEFGMSA